MASAAARPPAACDTWSMICAVLSEADAPEQMKKAISAKARRIIEFFGGIPIGCNQDRRSWLSRVDALLETRLAELFLELRDARKLTFVVAKAGESVQELRVGCVVHVGISREYPAELA